MDTLVTCESCGNQFDEAQRSPLIIPACGNISILMIFFTLYSLFFIIIHVLLSFDSF